MWTMQAERRVRERRRRWFGALLRRAGSSRTAVVHIAGHGEPGPLGGVVMSGGPFLGPREIKTYAHDAGAGSLHPTCCHGAALEAAKALADVDHVSFAYGRGRRADPDRRALRHRRRLGRRRTEPASLFATTFYGALLDGESFIGAVAKSARAAWQRGGNTGRVPVLWRPELGLARQRRPASAAPQRRRDGNDRLAVGLAIALRSTGRAVALAGRQGRRAVGAGATKLAARFDASWGRMGAIAEASACVRRSRRARGRDRLVTSAHAHAEDGQRVDESQRANSANLNRAPGPGVGSKRASGSSALCADAAGDGMDGRSRARASWASLAPTIERLNLTGSA